MPWQNKVSFHVYRFETEVALTVSVDGKGTTAYFSPTMAREIGKALLKCAEDTECRPFTASEFGTVTGTEDHGE